MDRKHVKCVLWKTLWGLGALSFLIGLTFSTNSEYWFWNALVLGILAIPIKLDCQSCKTCGIN